MNSDTPASSESSMRMLVQMSTGVRRMDVAQTGPPACASTTLVPMARSSVLLPDMFEPVTNTNVPGGPTETSLFTRLPAASSGCPSACASMRAGPSTRSGMTQSGLSCASVPSADSASASPNAASQSRAWAPELRCQRSSAAST